MEEKKVKGYGNLLEDKTGLLKHREWRGLGDTLFDFGFWMKNRMAWGLIRALRREAFKKGEDRYRWTVTYRILPHYYDMQCSNMRGPALRAARANQFTLSLGFATGLALFLGCDERFFPGNERNKKVIICDNLIPSIIASGFPDYTIKQIQGMPQYVPSLVNQQSGIHYIDVSESYGLPADVCPIPSVEAGIAIDDDYPRIGICSITTNMPCDGSIMTTTIQDRRIGLPTHVLNVPLRHTREDVQEYAVAEIKECIAFLEEQTGTKCNYEKMKEACEIANQQSRLKIEKWEMNMTDTPPHTGASVWNYRIMTYATSLGNPIALKNDEKVNKILRKAMGKKRKYPKVSRHRAVIWNTPANMYCHFGNWILDCWGVEVVCDMIDHQSTQIIDTSSIDSMLYGIAKAVQGSTMRVHTKGGYEVIMDDLWVQVEKYRADMIIMFDQISCKGVDGIRGLFEEEARKRHIHMMWIDQDLLDPRTISRRDMREQANKYMETVMGEKPVDPTLVDFDDSLSW